MNETLIIYNAAVDRFSQFHSRKIFQVFMLRINSVTLLILLACLYFNACHAKAIKATKTNKPSKIVKPYESNKTAKPVKPSKPSAPAFDMNPSLDKVVYIKCRYSKCKHEDKERAVPRDTMTERIKIYNEFMRCLTHCSNEILESTRELKRANEFYHKKYKEIFNDMYK
ncbi:hypothetical protein M514_04559, partial [Trichuris suis]